MTEAPLPTPLHSRLTVVRADAATGDVAHRLGELLASLGGLDLRTGAAPLVVGADRVRDAALGHARREHDERAAARDEAMAHRSGLAARRTHLLERAEWCDATAGTARALLVALEAAEAEVEAARAAVDAADGRRQRVADQRAAARAAVDEAELELESLDGAALDETGVRRNLESATRTQREALAAVDAAEAELISLRQRLVDLEAARAELVDALDRLAAEAGQPGDTDAEAFVREALEIFDELAAMSGPDLGAAALADAIGRVDEELADLRGRLPEPPSSGQLAGAESDVAAARRAVDAARAGAAAFDGPPPAWWVELTTLHASVVDAEAALDGAGFRKAAARRRYDEVVAAERATLAELGFGSYLEALMSGGRRADERSADEAAVSEAMRDLAAAEHDLDRLRRDVDAAAPIVECLKERERLLSLASGLLGCDPGERAVELLVEYPDVPPLVVEDLGNALRGVGMPTAGIGLAAAARQWLGARDSANDPERRAELERRIAEIDGERQTVESAIGPATAQAERAAESATAADRTVSSLEAELRARAGDDGRLLERAVAARALRDQVAAVEARLAAAEVEASEAWAAAAKVLAANEAERDRVDHDLTDLGRRASRAAAELPPERRPPVDLLTGLAPLGGALRAEAQIVADALLDADTRVKAAEAAVGVGPEVPTLADVAAGLVTAVKDAPPGPVVLDEPFAGLEAEDVEQLLAVIVDLSALRPTVVVTADLVMVGWAIGLPDDVGALVPARSLDGILKPTSQGAVPPTTTTDTTVSARPVAD